MSMLTFKRQPGRAQSVENKVQQTGINETGSASTVQAAGLSADDHNVAGHCPEAARMLNHPRGNGCNASSGHENASSTMYPGKEGLCLNGQ
jgi:hypothetical protein